MGDTTRFLGLKPQLCEVAPPVARASESPLSPALVPRRLREKHKTSRSAQKWAGPSDIDELALPAGAFPAAFIEEPGIRP